MSITPRLHSSLSLSFIIPSRVTAPFCRDWIQRGGGGYHTERGGSALSTGATPSILLSLRQFAPPQILFLGKYSTRLLCARRQTFKCCHVIISIDFDTSLPSFGSRSVGDGLSQADSAHNLNCLLILLI